jgi:hypothetical protein
LIRPDGTTVYTWSQVEQLLSARARNAVPVIGGLTFPSGTFIGSDAPPLLSLLLSSSPQGAQVFAVPFVVYDLDKTIVDSLIRLQPFELRAGKTDVTEKLFSQKYHIVFRLGAKRSEVDFDLFKGGPNSVMVDLQ